MLDPHTVIYHSPNVRATLDTNLCNVERIGQQQSTAMSCKKTQPSQLSTDSLYTELTEQSWETIGLIPGPIAAQSNKEAIVVQLSSLLEGRLSDVVIERRAIERIKNSGYSDHGAPLSPDPNNGALVLSPTCRSQIREYVSRIGSFYRGVNYHKFEHCAHVTISANRLLRMLYEQGDSSGRGRTKSTTFGIANDAFTKFAVVFSALIHDVDHQGVPNRQLCLEGDDLAMLYNDKSVAEQHSIHLGFSTLQNPEFSEFMDTIVPNSEDKIIFRRLVIDVVLATDIASHERQELFQSKWKEAFSSRACRNPAMLRRHSSGTTMPKSDEERSRLGIKSSLRVNGATIEFNDVIEDKSAVEDELRTSCVLDLIINAADVAHTLQSWENFVIWNSNLYNELYEAYKCGRGETDPGPEWFRNQIGFYDFYVLPLARKLRKCGAFGEKAGQQFVSNAKAIRKRWIDEGMEVSREILRNAEIQYRRKMMQKKDKNTATSSTNKVPESENVQSASDSDCRSSSHHASKTKESPQVAAFPEKIPSSRSDSTREKQIREERCQSEGNGPCNLPPPRQRADIPKSLAKTA